MEDMAIHAPLGGRITSTSAGSAGWASGTAQHEVYELTEMHKGSAKTRTTKLDGTEVDRYGSDPLDQRDMHRMGKEQEMKRVFRQFSLLSFSCVLMATWEFELMASAEGLVCGGRAGLFWSFIWTIFGYAFVVASLGEMASMAPTAGGQYHWVSEFAPPRYQRSLSYATGWMAVLTVQTSNCSGGFLVSELIQALLVLGNPGYRTSNWHGTLLVFPVMLTCLLFNVVFSSMLPRIQNVVMFLHVLFFLTIVIVLWVVAPHVKSHVALMEFQNTGGWSTMGLSLMIGQLSATSALGGADSAAHMSEECRDAGVVVPKAMMWTLAINGLMGFIMLITYLYSMPNVTHAINEVSGFPMIYVFRQAMSISSVMTIIVFFIVVLMAGNISFQAATARQTFAFARDHGLPFSSWLSKVSRRWMIPVNSVVFSASVAMLLSLINLGSATALNALLSLGAVSQMATYLISISCVLHRRITAPHLLPKPRWSLGRWGVPINIVAIAYSTLSFFWSFWPNTVLTTDVAQNFNWAPVMFLATLMAAVTTYVVKGRKVYMSPADFVQGRLD